jgi:hypothetical protein
MIFAKIWMLQYKLNSQHKVKQFDAALALAPDSILVCVFYKKKIEKECWKGQQFSNSDLEKLLTLQFYLKSKQVEHKGYRRTRTIFASSCHPSSGAATLKMTLF